MSIELVAVLLVIGVVAYVFFGRRKGASPPAVIVPDASMPATPEPELSAEERHIANAQSVARAGAEARAAAYNEHRASVADAQSRLREAEKFARESGLDVAVPWAWDHMQFWPGWKEKPDQWTPRVELEKLAGASREEVRWTWQGNNFGGLCQPKLSSEVIGPS